MFFNERYFSVNVNFIFVASLKTKIADKDVVQCLKRPWKIKTKQDQQLHKSAMFKKQEKMDLFWTFL